LPDRGVAGTGLPIHSAAESTFIIFVMRLNSGLSHVPVKDNSNSHRRRQPPVCAIAAVNNSW